MKLSKEPRVLSAGLLDVLLKLSKDPSRGGGSADPPGVAGGVAATGVA